MGYGAPAVESEKVGSGARMGGRETWAREHGRSAQEKVGYGARMKKQSGL